MDEVASLVIPSGNNITSKEWFLNTVLLPLDTGGLFNGNFIPPPPRPLFLDESITTDGLTTCDLCSWAWKSRNTIIIDTGVEAPGEVGWVLTLIIVSLLSAFVGAAVMIIVLHCKRLKSNMNPNAIEQNIHLRTNRPPISIPDDKTMNSVPHSTFADNCSNVTGVWTWLSRRPFMTTSQLQNAPSSIVENHYTHMEETYTGAGEVLYDELDVHTGSNSLSYQNSAYTDPDAPISSAPSSAYYSDLSVSTVPERTYEVVGTLWESLNNTNEITKPINNGMRLAAISEASAIASDYI